jgi:uncharacterized protein YdcH (DUF465 family)
LKWEGHCDILLSGRTESMEEQKIKERLLKENREFRTAFKQHQKLENMLSKFRAKGYLSEAERVKEKQLKKEKLVLKDRMYQLMTEFKKSVREI